MKRNAVYSVLMRVKGVSGNASSAGMSKIILALQVMVGTEPAGTVSKEADINGDGKIGLEEVIQWLRDAAGLR